MRFAPIVIDPSLLNLASALPIPTGKDNIQFPGYPRSNRPTVISTVLRIPMPKSDITQCQWCRWGLIPCLTSLPTSIQCYHVLASSSTSLAHTQSRLPERNQAIRTKIQPFSSRRSLQPSSVRRMTMHLTGRSIQRGRILSLANLFLERMLYQTSEVLPLELVTQRLRARKAERLAVLRDRRRLSPPPLEHDIDGVVNFIRIANEGDSLKVSIGTRKII